jgi:fumarylacetoacetate (FAA) hydrolase
VSNKDWSHGYSCIAEKRAIETIEHGQPRTAFMQPGDTIRIEVKGRDGASIFGAIDQRVRMAAKQQPAAPADPVASVPAST